MVVNASLWAKFIAEENILLLPQGKALLFWVKTLVEEFWKMSICAKKINSNFPVAIGSDRLSSSVTPSLDRE